MKTQIVYLAPYDDVHSIRDKIDWGRGERILLVWPIRGQLLKNKLEMVLLQRHSQAAGGQIALVTKGGVIRRYARELGIPVFRSLRQAQSTAWEYTLTAPPQHAPKKGREKDLKEIRSAIHPKPTSSHFNTPTARLLIFLIGVLGFLSILAIILPSAEIRLTPKAEPQQITLSISANPRFQSYNLTGAVPAQTFTVVVEGRKTIRTSGEIDIPMQPSTGEVTFTNLTDQAYTIPVGTVVRTIDEPPIRFATTAAGEMPAEAGAVILIPIEALNPGSAGNLHSDSLKVVEGNLALNISATNPVRTTGGSERNSAAPSPEDYDQLTSDLMSILWESALEEIQRGLDPQDLILDISPRVVNIVEETFTPEELQPSSELSLLLRVEFEMLVVTWQDLSNMSNAILDATLPAGYITKDDSLIIQRITEPIIREDNVAEWEILVTRVTFNTTNENKAIDQILGLPPDVAREQLIQSLSLEGAPEIRITPAWWPRLPFLRMQIKVINE
jgi:hypothetical protein